MSNPMLTLDALFTNALTRFGSQTAVWFEGESLTYHELLEQGYQVAHALIRHGIRPGTRVALAMPNRLEYVVADQGIIQSGAAKVALNDMLGDDEVIHILTDSNTRVAIVAENRFDVLLSRRDELPELDTVVGLAPQERCPTGIVSWQSFHIGEIATKPEAPIHPDDLAWLPYTGGTTGRPKGVLHSQQNICLNLFSHVMEMGLQDDERLLLTSPLSHSAGILLQAGLLKGATHYIEQQFDPDQVIECISRNGVTLTFMVPTMIYRVLDWIEGKPLSLGSLRTVLYGAAPITLDRLRQGLEQLGPVFMQLYGQSEAPNFVTRLLREDHDPEHQHRLLSCGRPATMAQVRIVDSNGNDVPTGESGELIARTPYNMLGYHGQPGKTAETIVNGWLHTGDIARMDDDGYVYLLDRKNDMIITGGMNVYTTEVENAIQDFPGVNQVAVVGLPDDDWGEAVTGFVVLSPGHNKEADAIIAHCRSRLTRYKVPKRIMFVESLPVTAYGKTDKKRLRQQWTPTQKAE
ncbi:AMP-binding protein [Marinobacter sp. OP 3.4]|uniref:AMP-binding protein n=1 Tax=Marinobacter sp. OP 3.4 TaxID=3076501 RepID=UPI002E1D6992